MRLLLAIYIVVPSVNRFPLYANKFVFSWSCFGWYPGTGWVVFVQYAFVGVPAFVFIGLTTFLPFLLLALLLLRPKSGGRDQAIICLAVALVLLAVYANGWLLYTWPIPYQPTQTYSIILFTVLAYLNWRQTFN